MIPFTESLRHAYPLTPQSVCVDVGAYKGGWAKTMHEKYGCIVLAFEPIAAFYAESCSACAQFPRITLFNVGLSDHFHSVEMGVQNDSSGEFATSEVREKVILMDVHDHLKQVHKGPFALIKINAEGGEYPIMERLIKQGALGMFDNYQIQFHTCAPDYQKRYDSIAAALSETHELTWREPFVWENWRKK